MNEYFLLDVLEFWTKDLIIYDWQVYNLSEPYGNYVIHYIHLCKSGTIPNLINTYSRI